MRKGIKWCWFCLVLLTINASAFAYHINISITSTCFMDLTIKNKEERKQLAKAILELHDLYISTGEEKKPMTISLPDLAEMAGLSKEVTEATLTQFLEGKLIRIEKITITILEKRKLKKIAA